MHPNKIAVKLSIYFAVSLLCFSIIIGSIFILLLKSHVVDLHKNQILIRAESIASSLSDYMDSHSQMQVCGIMGYSLYLQFIRDIAGTDVWIVDKDLNLMTGDSSMASHSMIGDFYQYNYADLPENAENLVQEVFAGKTAVGGSFSGLFAEATLTVGAPIRNEAGGVIGVVLLHSPVDGVNDGVAAGIKLLLISLGIALAIVMGLSVWLSKNFTQPIVSKEADDALRFEKLRREFIADISHELKTPITVIRGSLEALIEKVVTDPAQIEEYHSQMLHEAAFLQRLVGDLLDLSKLQNVDFLIEKQDISLSALIDDTVRSMAPFAHKKKIKINVCKSVADYRIYGDYGRMRQMLMIVMDNAVKFSSENSAVDLLLEDKALTIRDYGKGIPQSELPFIFDRFYRSHSEQNKQGTGLGLAIARQIAQRHDIEILVKSDEGKGAEFILKMP